MRNWKTTLAGVVPGLIIFLYDFVRGLQAGQQFDLKTMILGLAIAMLGAFAKDYNATGGTVPTTKEAETRVNGKTPTP